MKAALFDRFGPPAEVLSAREVPMPEPKRGEVLVRMLASPVNPSDLLFVGGQYGLKPSALPATPGLEGVGIVEKSGGGLLGRFRVGKRVVVLGSRTGGWAEFAVAKAKQVFPVPDELPDEQAASLFVNPATAWVLTREVLAVPKGEWLLQTAAGSALGRMVIRLGTAHGFRTVNVVRRAEQADELRQLGADEVVVADGGGFAAEVRRLTGGGVQYALDPVGGAVGAGVVESLSPGGTAVLYGLLSGEPVSVDPRFLITGSKRVQGFWLSDWANQASVVTKLRLLRRLSRLVSDGTLATETGPAYPLDRVAEAVAEAARPGHGGKVLLRIGAR